MIPINQIYVPNLIILKAACFNQYRKKLRNQDYPPKLHLHLRKLKALSITVKQKTYSLKDYPTVIMHNSHEDE